MSIKEILTSGGGILLLFLTLIQITPLKINPWSWIVKRLGNALNGDLIKKVDKLSDSVQSLDSKCDEREATSSRYRIICFGDECLHGVHHSKERFNQILNDITNYEHYCNTHPDFENDQAVETIEIIKDIHKECIRNNSFLQ